MTTGPSSPGWRLTAPEALHWRRWEEEWVLYDGASGDTHLLEPAGAGVLHGLQRSPATVEELAAGLERELHLAPGEELLGYVGALLAQLHKLGMVEPA